MLRLNSPSMVGVLVDLEFQRSCYAAIQPQVWDRVLIDCHPGICFLALQQMVSCSNGDRQEPLPSNPQQLGPTSGSQAVKFKLLLAFQAGVNGVKLDKSVYVCMEVQCVGHCTSQGPVPLLG